MVANLHADPRYRLDVGSTVNIGRPWIEGAAADHLLVSLPTRSSGLEAFERLLEESNVDVISPKRRSLV